MELEIGKAYFLIGYPMAGLEVPIVETYIFIGKDVMGGCRGAYFFQSPDSYFEDGFFPSIEDSRLKDKAEICTMDSDVVEALLDIEELSNSLLDLKLKSPDIFGIICGRPS